MVIYGKNALRCADNFIDGGNGSTETPFLACLPPQWTSIRGMGGGGDIIVSRDSCSHEICLLFPVAPGHHLDHQTTVCVCLPYRSILRDELNGELVLCGGHARSSDWTAAWNARLKSRESLRYYDQLLCVYAAKQNKAGNTATNV